MKHNALLPLFATLLLVNPAFADVIPPRTVSVVGEAREEMAPDQAVLSGQLVSKAKQLNEAKQQNDKLVERVLKITTKFEIPKGKVVASNVHISPEYRYEKDTNKQIQDGYVVSRNLSITMDKLEVHEALLSALVDSGIDQVNGVNFTLADPEAHEDALRVKAIHNAKVRATALAEAAGAKLGKVLSITMQGGATPPMRPMAMALSARAEKSSVAPSLPGLLNMDESVLVTFELE